MKKFALVVIAIMTAVSLCGVLWADDEGEHPIPSPIDKYVPDTDLFGGKTPDFLKKSQDTPVRRADEQQRNSQSWHSEAKYRITQWFTEENVLTLEVEAKNGEETDAIIITKGKLANERKVNLRGQFPIQFTVPDGVEVVHLWKDKGYNYKITKDGKLKELPVKGNGRMAYPGDTVLVKDGNTMTVWLLQ